MRISDWSSDGCSSDLMSVSDGRAFWKLFGPNGAQYTVTHKPRFVADDLLTLKFAIEGGVGLGVLPDYMCRDEIAAGTLVPVLPGWAPQPGIIHAVFGSRRGLVPAVRSSLDFLGERMVPEAAAGRARVRYLRAASRGYEERGRGKGWGRKNRTR